MSLAPLDLVTLAYCDLGAVVRGRSMPANTFAHKPESVGWVPSSVARPPLGRSVRPNPFGALGDLRLLPDVDTMVTVEAEEPATALNLVLCDLVETDGRPWAGCPRQFLRDALGELQHELDARLVATFEHEFQLVLDTPCDPAMSVQAQRALDPFPALVMGALHRAGLEPERFVPESAPHQFEIPVAACEGIASADRAVLLREIVREITRRQRMRVTFMPIANSDDQGNGVHVHLSLQSSDGTWLFHARDRPSGLSDLAGQFAAGLLRHARALSALCAPNPTSYARLMPQQRAAGAVCLAECNREALVRIPPRVTIDDGDPASQLRLEYRGADATANPYLVLGALVHAGLAGVRERLAPPSLLDRDPADLDPAERRRLGVSDLPTTVEEALDALRDDALLRGAMAPLLYDTYVAIKRAEVEAARGEDLEDLTQRYARAF